MGPARPLSLHLGQCGMSYRPDPDRVECDTDPALRFENVDGILDFEDTLVRGWAREHLQTC